MARWNPDDVVDDKEIIGRRLFGETQLRGAQGQPNFSRIPLAHFRETRVGEDLSVERLGRSNPEGQVLSYLRPRAEYAGKKLRDPKTFDGWATVRAKVLRSQSTPALDARSDKVAGTEPDDNVFHALIVGGGALEAMGKEKGHVVAIQFRFLVETQGELLAADGTPRPHRG